jgi:ubiquinone/menaquinone biosynthesis C-methylase UbiE
MQSDSEMSGIREFEYAGWQAAAEAYAKSFAVATAQFVPPLLDAVSASAGVTLLDVACGPGVVSAQAAARGAKTTGIDFSPEMIRLAQKANPHLEFHVSDVEQLPFDNAHFDAVVVNFGLHHFERPQRALAEIRRVLRPQGRIAYTKWVSQRDNPPYRMILDAIAEHGTMDVPMPAGQDASLSIEELNRMAREAGFTINPTETSATEKLWQLPLGTDLIDVFSSATARMTILLRAQSAESISRIRAQVAHNLRRYVENDAIRIPVRAFVVSAVST